MATKSRSGSQSTISNQLSLFSEVTDAELGDNLIEESIDERNDYITPLGHKILEHWRHHRPTMVENLAKGNQLQQAVFAAQELTGNLLYELTVVQKMDYQIRVGDRDEGMGVPPGRGGSAPVVVRSSDPRPAPTLARDLRITPAHGIGEGGLKQKAQANLAAIRTLKSIEAEDRLATPEEKAALVKYTGWGAMPNAFEPQPPREWQGVADELRELLSAEEYASARASTPNAHYTSPEVVQAIWQAMERFGLQAGRANPRAVHGCRSFLRHDARRVCIPARGAPALSWIPSPRASPPNSTRIRAFTQRASKKHRFRRTSSTRPWETSRSANGEESKMAGNAAGYLCLQLPGRVHLAIIP